MPVHDALQQLAKEGLVYRHHNCRAHVAGITTNDIFEIFEMRKFLEKRATELAAGRLDARQRAPLQVDDQAPLQATARGKNWTSQRAGFDDLFHTTNAHAGEKANSGPNTAWQEYFLRTIPIASSSVAD